MQPLPENRDITRPDPARGNPGLIWNKFADVWPHHASTGVFKGLGGEEKQQWIKRFAKTFACREANKAAARMAKLAAGLGGQGETLATTAPFVTGMGLEHPVENGFLWHHAYGAPCLPGSSVKGLVRAWAEHWQGVEEDVINNLFGPPASDEDHGAAGALIFFDALPAGKVTLMAEVMTPHDGGWRQGDSAAPSDWHSPVPIPFLTVAPGAEFTFAIAPRPGSGAGEEDVKTAMNWLKQALDWMGAGAKTATGFGRFEDEEAGARREREAREQAKQAREEQARQDMRISVGDRVTDEYGETGVVLEITGEEALVDFDGDQDTIALKELKKIK